MLTKDYKPYKGKLDVIGMGVSIACAIHCVILPVFFTTLPMFGMEVLKNIFLESITVILSAIIGSWALIRGFKKYHRQMMPVVIFFMAMAFLIVANFYSGAAEGALKVIAISGIITAHILNWRYSFRTHGHGHSQAQTHVGR